MHHMAPTIRSLRRRNALIPLPLLPPVPRNTIVTSVRIVHNQSASDPNILDSNGPHLPQVRGFSNSPSPPPSPTPTNLCFAPLTGGAAKRLRSGRRRSSCTPCQPPPCQPPPGSQRSTQKPPPSSVAVPFDGGTDSRMYPPARPAAPDDNFDSSLLNPNRKPRSTIVVTVRLANPPPSNASYGSRPPGHVPAPRRTPHRDTGPDDDDAGGGTVHGTRPRQPPDRVIGVGDAFAAMQARIMAHRPRVSSPLVSSVVTLGDDPDRMELDPWDVSPLSSPPASWSPLYGGGTAGSRGPFTPNARRYTKKSKNGPKKGGKAKNGGRIGMLRWAVLNDSGPEIGRRILAMGPKLAQEIWEAERSFDEIEAMESNQMDVTEHKHWNNVESPDDSDQFLKKQKHGSNLRPPSYGDQLVMERKHGSNAEPPDDSNYFVTQRRHGDNPEPPDDSDQFVMEHKHGGDAEPPDDGGQFVMKHKHGGNPSGDDDQFIMEQKHGSNAEPPDDSGQLVMEHKHGGNGDPHDDTDQFVMEHKHGGHVDPPGESGQFFMGGDVEPPDDGAQFVTAHKHGGNLRPPGDNDPFVTEQTYGCDMGEQKARELLAEECIRELEEMEVDSEDTEMEQSSMEESPSTPPTPEAITTEKAIETHQLEKNSNRMDLDMPAPVAVVTPLSTARQVQIQLEIAVQVFSPAKKAQKDAEKSRRWFERIAL